MRSRSANVWVLCSEGDAPRAKQTCSPLVLGPNGTCAVSASLAWAFLGEVSASAVNRSGRHGVRLATSGQMLRDDAGPAAHRSALGDPGAGAQDSAVSYGHTQGRFDPAGLGAALLLRHLGLRKLALGWGFFCQFTAKSGSFAQAKPTCMNRAADVLQLVPLRQ